MLNIDSMNLQKANKILFHSKYVELLKTIETKEETRIYCKHNMEHFLNVARIMMILNLENGNSYSSDVVYGTALLHDIGRAINDENHNKESVEIAKSILEECGYSTDEINLISNSISNHRKDNSSDLLSEFLYFADKKSRNCFDCKASKTCNWNNEKRTNKLII